MFTLALSPVGLRLLVFVYLVESSLPLHHLNDPLARDRMISKDAAL